MTRRRHLPTLVLAAALLAAVPADAHAQPAGRCDLVFDNTPTTRFTSQKIGENTYNTFLGGGVFARCAGQQVTLRSDSAEAYGASNVIYLIGSVRYVEPRARVDADRMTYFRNDERLLAEGRVHAVLPTGTEMRGPTADYYRAVTGIRLRTRLYAPGRPTVILVEKDTVGKRGEPTRMVANAITMEGDSLVYAGGSVEITRTDVEARGDSAFMDSGTEFARLMRRPSIVGKQRRPFTLKGTTIDLFSRQRQLARVLALGAADATSEDMRLTSDTIDMRLSAAAASNTVERVYVWGKSRARATSPDRDIEADSLDIRMPGQRLHEVHALRDAYAQVAPDTTKIRSSERDWMRGDTLVARFDTTQAPASPASPAPPAGNAPAGARPGTPVAAAPRDTTPRTKIRDLVARGSARSYFQVPSQQGPAAPPAINYVRGRQITVTFAAGAVDRVTVVDRAAGVYIEPAADTAAARPANARPGARPNPPRP